MTEALLNWIEDNKISISESSIEGSDIVSIEDIGDFLYLKPFDGKVIDEDFAFILSDEEFELLETQKVKYILFEFGTKFYYSGIKQTKNRYNEMIYKPEFLDFKHIGKINEEFIMDFAHLGVHTEYEMMNGSGSCELWAKKAKFMGLKYLGICDRNTMAGVLSFQTACLKNGMKSVIGETITVAKNYDVNKNVQETFEMKLFVLNEAGWKNLLMVNKAINIDYNGFIPDEELYTHGNGLCCVVPKDSEFNYIKDDKKEVFKLISKYKKAFDEVYYQIDTVEYVSDTLFKEHLKNIDVYLCNYQRVIKPILINDSYYVDKESHELKGLLNKLNGKASPESGNQFMKTVSETISAYGEWVEDVEPLFNIIALGIENSFSFAKRVNYAINTGERKLPKYEVDDIESLFFAELERGVNERLSEFKGKELQKYLDAIEIECAVIVPNGLLDYFMILWDVLKWCRSEDINVGPGRGSVCGSLVAYLLYITDVDPLKYDLLFERFLNEARVSGERAKSADSMPDIDLDFPTKRREDVKNYIKQKYGYAYTCAIGSYTRMKLKTCLKDFGKVKGIPFDIMNKLTKDIDDQIEYTWGDLIEYASKSKSLFKFVQENPDLIHLTKYALLQCKAASIHPSASIIVPKEDLSGNPINLFEWMPVKKIDGVLVSEWEGKYIDKSGFLKEDILGLSQLDKFKSILNLIKVNQNKELDVNKIPFDDEEVFKYFKRGWCEDVFQFGTMGLMNYCRQVKPDSLDHLIAMTSLFRPGPMESNAHQDFADIKNGKKKAHFDFGLHEVTKNTSGLYVYQEQIMKAVNVLGGLSLVEADQLRTYMKKKDKKAMGALSVKFIAGAISKGCSEKEANEIWTKLDKFSGYGFNKCISGKEIIKRVGITNTSFKPTIEEMFNIKNDRNYAIENNHYHLWKKYNHSGYGMCFSLQNDRLIRNKIIDIRYAGFRETFKVKLKSGKTISVTDNHKFPTNKGERCLYDIAVGDKLFINDNYEQSILDKDKYNLNAGFNNFPSKGQQGFQKTEMTGAKLFDEFIDSKRGCPCENCGGSSKQMEAHHIDGVHNHHEMENLIWLCNSCHKKAHYELGRVTMGKKGLLTKLDKIVSIVSSGFEDVYDVEVSGEVSHTFLTDGDIVTCNSHAAAYTMMSYWSQWFKVNYPLEFWTTALQESSESDIPFRLSEMKKTGAEIEIRPPDINFSDSNFTCDYKENRIFFSLTKIKGVGDIAVENIMNTRNEGGRFFSLEEFLKRVPSKVNKTVVERLIVSGAFDLIENLNSPRDRKKLLKWYLEDVKGSELSEAYQVPDSTNNSFWVFEQKRLTGFGEVDYENMIKDSISNKRIAALYVDGIEFSNSKEGAEITIAGKVIGYNERQIKNGTMCSLNIDSNNTVIGVTIWPDVWDSISEDAVDLKNRVIAINGIVKKDKWKGVKVLYSDKRTRVFIIS